MEQQTGSFKTATFGGFDRKSVLDYIDTLSEKTHAQELEYKAQIDEYAKAQESQIAYIKRLECELSEASGKLEAVADELEANRNRTGNADARILELDEENQTLQQKLNASIETLQARQDEYRQLQFKVEGIEFKSKKYDEISSQIGEAMIEAKRTAEQTIDHANAKAGEILRQAQTQAEKAIAEAKMRAENTMREASATANDISQRAQQEADSTIMNATLKAEALSSEAQSKAEEMTRQAEVHVAEITSRAITRRNSLCSELTSFKADSARLRKSIEEILFVLNDRIDIMQEVVRNAESRIQDTDDTLSSSAESAPQSSRCFQRETDSAGYFTAPSISR